MHVDRPRPEVSVCTEHLFRDNYSKPDATTPTSDACEHPLQCRIIFREKIMDILSLRLSVRVEQTPTSGLTERLTAREAEPRSSASRRSADSLHQLEPNGVGDGGDAVASPQTGAGMRSLLVPLPPAYAGGFAWVLRLPVETSLRMDARTRRRVRLRAFLVMVDPTRGWMEWGEM